MLLRAIIISDMTDVMDSIYTALNNEGFEVLSFQDGIEGTKKVYETLPDVVIAEDRLSRTASVDLCCQVRDLPAIATILLGEEDVPSSDIVNGLERGADYYLKRPISIAELVARVKCLLRRRREAPQGLRHFLNVDEHSVMLDDRTVRLTPIEFRLLSYMALNRDRVIPVAELLLHIWAGEQVTEESLRFHISQLRQKLDHGSPNLISNQRGVGYRLTYDREFEDTELKVG